MGRPYSGLRSPPYDVGSHVIVQRDRVFDPENDHRGTKTESKQKMMLRIRFHGFGSLVVFVSWWYMLVPSG